MKHYDFADVLKASDDQMEMEIWQEELGGKVVVASQVTTGSADVGPVPMDNNFPLSGVHANVMHTILTGNFLLEVGPLQMFIVELLLVGLLFLLALRSSQFPRAAQLANHPRRNERGDPLPAQNGALDGRSPGSCPGRARGGVEW